MYPLISAVCASMLFYFADGGSILDVKDEFVPMNMNKRSGLIGLGSD